MAKSGGVIGIMFWPYLTREGQPMAIDVIRHIEHAIDVCGEDHVGIGTDGGIASTERTEAFEKENLASMQQTAAEGIFGPNRKAEGLYYFIPDLNVADRFDVLAGMLARRGHKDARIEKILGGNFARVLGEDIDRVPLFHDMGVRVIQLTHNRRNIVGDGATEPGNAGLSKYGHEVVARLEAAKIVVDLAHGSQRTIAEGIAAAKRPLLISHTGCRALADLPRNTNDAELRALADKGGVAGMIFWPYLRTDTQPMAIDVIRHIEHAIDVCGEDHVGVGTDGSLASTERTPEFEKQNLESMRQTAADGIFGPGRKAEGLYYFIPDLNAPNRFDLLAAKLSARGHSDARIEKILGGNFSRVFAEVWG